MLKRFYADNYKCFVNFEYRPRRLELILGPNGAGKTSLFECMRKLRDFVTNGRELEEAFPPSTLTRWQNRLLQSFEIELATNEGVIAYELEVEHDEDKRFSRISHEILKGEGGLLFKFAGEEMILFNDNYKSAGTFPADPSRSPLFNVPNMADNRKMAAFKKSLSNLISTRINPMGMAALSEHERQAPDYFMTDFPSWYRHLTQEKLDDVVATRDALREVMDDFDGMVLTSAGRDRRELTVRMKAGETPLGGNTFEVQFSELSDGQRALVVLYTLLHCSLEKDVTICVDEPENFVALRELQPWLLALEDRVEATGGQVLIISHHPEFINLLSPENAVVFSRSGGGPVRLKPFSESEEGILPPAELVARGWDA